MLYLITLGVITTWMIVLLCKRQFSWHSIVSAYVIGEFTADMFEGLFNLILGLYRFPTHLSANPLYDNEYGVIFADFLILPFSFIVYVHYAAKTKHPWPLSILFAAAYILLECFYVKLGYMKYIHWNLIFSATFYVAGFRFGAYLAPRIASYDPPIPYRIRLLSMSHMILMWTSAIFALPLLGLYQFKPGLFKEFMTDCRVAELLTGDLLSVLIVIFIPMIPRKFKPPTFAFIALIGVAVALFFYHKGWLIYYRWNHFLMALRYFIPIALIMWYDWWESDYKLEKSASLS